jgi:hypothetical protein
MNVSKKGSSTTVPGTEGKQSTAGLQGRHQQQKPSNSRVKKAVKKHKDHGRLQQQACLGK